MSTFEQILYGLFIGGIILLFSHWLWKQARKPLDSYQYEDFDHFLAMIYENREMPDQKMIYHLERYFIDHGITFDLVVGFLVFPDICLEERYMLIEDINEIGVEPNNHETYSLYIETKSGVDYESLLRVIKD